MSAPRTPKPGICGRYISASVGARAVAVLFQKETGTRFSFVPYRGYPAAVQDLMAGQIDMLFGPLDQLPLMRAAGIKAYAVTSETRTAMAPEIPTYAEMGLPAFVYSAWEGLFTPKGTPKDIISRLNAAAVCARSTRWRCSLREPFGRYCAIKAPWVEGREKRRPSSLAGGHGDGL
jgi:tripartite-type tricarboxylate transporter receptor subunit TctC